MAEYRAISPKDSFKFIGLVDVKELFNIIYEWLGNHAYERNDIWTYEEVYEDGKQIKLKMRPYKEISDYAMAEIEINADLRKLKEVTLERKGVKHKYMKGEVEFTFEAFIVTDYEEKWEVKPFYFFLKVMAERFLYKSYIDRYEQETLKNMADLMREIKSYLNMQRF